MRAHYVPPTLPVPAIAADCWLVVGGFPLAPPDEALRHSLAFCHRVQIVTASEFATGRLGTSRVSVGVISGTCGPLELREHPSLPLLAVGAAEAWRSLRLANDSSWIPSASSLRIANDSHALAAGFARGHLPVYEKPGRLLVATPCAGATSVAHPSLLPAGRAALFGYERGAELCGGGLAAARRVALGFEVEAWSARVGEARASKRAFALLGAALLWLAGADEPATRGALGAVRASAHADFFSAAASAEFVAYGRARAEMAAQNRRGIGGAGGGRGGGGGDGDAGSLATSRAPPASCPAVAQPPRCDTSAEAAEAAEVAVLLHTCDDYAGFWRGWAHHWGAHWDHALCWPLVFANEHASAAAVIEPLRGCGAAVSAAPTGRGEFSSRYARALRSLSTPAVFYLQEDVWLTRPPAELPDVLRCAAKLVSAGHFDGVRLEAPSVLGAGLYALEDTGHRCGGHVVYRFAPLNRWLFSHQPGVWRRSLLLEAAEGQPAVVTPGEDPWANELLGSQRAEARGARVALVAVDWCRSVSSSGVLNPDGRAMAAAAEEEAGVCLHGCDAPGSVGSA